MAEINKYLVNKHGILHVFPDGLTSQMVELEHREATAHEIAQYLETGEQVIKRMPPEPPATPMRQPRTVSTGEKEQ